MAGEKYYICIGGSLVLVTQEVYQAYHQEERRAKTLEEKDRRHSLTRYSGLDTEELCGEELIPDRDAVSVEDAAIANILWDKLYRCLAMLSQPERELIHALFFEELSERQVAQRMGRPQRTVHDWKCRTLAKLKKLF